MYKRIAINTGILLGFVALATGLSGCPFPVDPNDQAEYDAGFNAGFAEDGEYWTGYWDSWDTVDLGPIYYQGGEIPELTEPAYDAGYWDGVWYAYNDGYFVAYDFAFTIGFSEGYDLGYDPDWFAFLAADEHFEYLDGGFSDGYHDGFSEGRIFGVTDYLSGLPFDWLDAMLYYREGNDVYIEELDLGTGLYGPVYLYEWGTDPNTLIKSTRHLRSGRSVPAIRKSGDAKVDIPPLSYRPLITDAQNELNVKPTTSPRSNLELLLNTTWLQRINAYLDAMKAMKSGEMAPAQR
jgi:hypothetical protein